MTQASSAAPLILVDGSSYLYRAFHALPALSTTSGEPTGAVKGVIAMLRRLLKDYPTSTIAVVFDAKGKTFRDAIYPAYKAHRPPMPDELREQIAPIHRIIQAMGLPLIIVDGVEADDVMGSYACQAAGRPVLLSTGDKDMAQLVNQHVTLINTMTDTTLDEQGVQAAFGIPPSLMVDYLALMGDSSDNIPGVAGIGKKTALTLLQHIGGLDALYDNLDKITELPIRGTKAIKEKLLKGKQQAYLSYQLATIKTDVDLPLAIEQLVASPADNEALLTYFKQLEFNAWAQELASEQATPEHDYQLILTETDFTDWLDRLKQAKLFALDTETTSLDYMQARVVGVSFAVAPEQAAYVPFAHDYPDAPQQLSEAYVLGSLQPLLEDPTVAKVGHHLKYDKSVLANHGIDLQGIVFDTLLELYVLNPTASRHNMDSLALKYLSTTTTHFEDIAGKGSKQLTFNQIDLAQAAPYAAEDADITLRLHQALWPKLIAEPSLQRVFETIERPLIPLLSTVERTGVLIDGELLQQQSKELGERLAELESQVLALAGETFNLNSPKQLAVILFDKLALPVIKKNGFRYTFHC